MLVRELMCTTPVTVAADTSLREALRVLAAERITALPVLDASGALVGVVSEIDLLPHLVGADPRAHARPLPETAARLPRSVAEVMTLEPLAVNPETDALAALHLMLDRSVRSLPVVDHRRRVVGIVSRSDLALAMSATDDQLASRVVDHLGAAGLTGWAATVTDGDVALRGPGDATDRALAHLVARTVPGVRSVSRS